jgi:hypothetical protein
MKALSPRSITSVLGSSAHALPALSHAAGSFSITGFS